MDISRYQKDREKELQLFQKEYADLKTNYRQSLTQAVYESDPQKQSTLVQQILNINSNLAKHVREFVQNSRGKFDPALISELTADIIRYQKEFEAIQSASDKSEALKKILDKQRTQLDGIQNQFNIWICVLLGGIALVLVMIFRTSLMQMKRAAESLMPSTSSFDSEYSSDSMFPDESQYRTSPL